MVATIVDRVLEGLVGATSQYDVQSVLYRRYAEAVLAENPYLLDGCMSILARTLHKAGDVTADDCMDVLDSLGSKVQYVNVGSHSIFALYLRKGALVAMHADISNGLLMGGIRLDVYGKRGVDQEVVDELIEAFKGKVRSQASATDKVTISYAYQSASGVAVMRKDADPLPFSDIEMNYTASVRPAIRELIPVLKDANRGLVTISGPPGTGKTWLLRSIMTEVGSDRDTLICMPPSAFITQGHILIEAINQVKRPVVVFEDLGNLFAMDYRAESPDAFSTFLNMADGLLSLMSEAVFVLTFNEKIDRMDPAMTRPGRCLGNIEIPNLTYDEALALLPEDRRGRLAAADTSLARVYSIINGGQVTTRTNDGAGTGFLALAGRNGGRGV